MSIYLGNLSVEQIEEQHEITLSDEDRKWLKEHRQENVSVPLAKDRWHCFDIPRLILADSDEFRREIYNRLEKYPFKGQIGIGVQFPEEL